MAYVAMTRGRHNNQAYLYQEISDEADDEHATPTASPQIHHLRRGDKYTAARAFCKLLANDDRPTTTHALAEQIRTEQLTDIVTDAIERNQHRRRARRTVWNEHVRVAEAWRDGYDRVAAAAATYSASIDLDAGLEL